MSDIISVKIKVGKEITEEEIEQYNSLLALNIYKALIYNGYCFIKNARIFKKTIPNLSQLK